MERGELIEIGGRWVRVLAIGLLMQPAVADEPPMMRPEDRVLLGRQSEEVVDAVSEVTRDHGGSVVWVWSGGRQVALGTVVGDGSLVLTKWSELGGERRVECVTGGRQAIEAEVAGVYEDDDVAVLKLGGTKLEPIRWSAGPPPGPGRFLAAAAPDGSASAWGVVGVEERSLRASDQAFLGVAEDPAYEGRGVQVGRVFPDTAAAAADLERGDVLLRVGERPVNGLYELRTALAALEPGAAAELWVSRDGDERRVVVELGRRPEMRRFPAMRMRQMEGMAGPNGLSVVGDGFPEVIQTDMKIAPRMCGAPVFDLNRRVVGLVIARSTRTRSFMIPSSRVVELLKAAPVDPGLVRNSMEPAPPGAGRGAGRGGAPGVVPDPGRARQMMNEIEKWLNRYLDETGSLENR